MKAIYQVCFYDKPIEGQVVLEVKMKVTDLFEANEQSEKIAKATNTYFRQPVWLKKAEE